MGSDTDRTGHVWLEPVIVTLAMIAPTLVPSGAPPDTITWLYSGAVQSFSQGALLMVSIGASGRLRDYGIARPRSGDVLRAALLVGIMVLIARLVVIFMSIAGSPVDPIGAVLPGTPGAPPAVIIAAGACFSLAVAYREELFYRIYVMRALHDRGAGTLAAVLVSTGLFAAGHAYQGAAGIVSALLVGAVFATAASRGFRLHALALAHAVYDFGVLLAALGLAGGPGR